MCELRYKKYLYLCTVHFKIKSGQRTGISSTSMNPTVRNKLPLMEMQGHVYSTFMIIFASHNTLHKYNLSVVETT